MPDEDLLCQRVREVLAQDRRVTEKPLMGTRAFLVNGAMCCSVAHNGLLIRVEAGARERMLAKRFVSPVELGTRTMKGFVRVAPEGLRTRAQLAKWIEHGLAAAAVRGKKVAGRRGSPEGARRGKAG